MFLKKSLPILFWIAFASATSFGPALADQPTTEIVADAGMVKVYELPVEDKQVILGNDGEIYAIEYSMWSKTDGKTYPGISVGQWYTDSVTGKFFPWRNNPGLAKSLSESSQEALRGLLEPNGDLELWGYSNGGGFVYSNYNSNSGIPGDFSNRPENIGGTNEGLLYYYNGSGYFTKGGNQGGGRIQAYGGCIANTISEGATATPSKLVENGDYCKWSGSDVESSEYAPVFDGGTLKIDSSNPSESISRKFYVTSNGGTIENDVNTIFAGDFEATLGSESATFTYSGTGLTRLSGTNEYSGETIINTTGDGALVIEAKKSLPLGNITINSGSILRLRGDAITSSKGQGIKLEGGGKIGVYGKKVRLNSDIQLVEPENGQSFLYVDGALDRQTVEDGVYIRPQINGVISGAGGLTKIGEGSVTLTGVNTYTGKTKIKKGQLEVSGSLSDKTEVEVAEGAKYNVRASDQIAALTGGGRVELDKGGILSVGDARESFQFDGSFVEDQTGGLTKLGSSDFIITKNNAIRYKGDTTVNEGSVVFGNTSQEIQTLVVKGLGAVSGGDLAVVDLDNHGEISVNSLVGTGAKNTFDNIYGSIAIASESNIDLKGGDDTFSTNANVSGSGIIDGGEGTDTIKFGTLGAASFKATKIKNFEFAEQHLGEWDYDGDYKSAGIETMTLKGGKFLLLDSERAKFATFVMEGGEIHATLESKDSAPLIADVFDYKSGSLVIAAADQVDPEGTYTVIDAPASSQGEMNELASNSHLVYDDNVGDFSGIGEINGIDGSAIYDVYLKEGSLQLVVSKKAPEEIIDCLDDDSCDKDVPSDEKDIVDEIIEPGSPGNEIVDENLDDVLDEIDLPIIGYGELAKLVVSGLAPRNIDGTGRGMATYNNLLADTLLERLPLRQFDPVVIEETVLEQEDVIETDPAPPVRGLWSKSGEVSDQEAQQALDRAIVQTPGIVLEEGTLFESLEVGGFVEDPSLTAQYARRDGVRAWFRAFGGDDRDSYNDDFYNPYYLNTGGGVLGVDVSVTESFQVGAFVNYGNINLIQQSALAGGGSWNPDGWGGGVRADYWTDNFYVQGLFSATAFSGNHKRNIIEITSQLGDETASGTKSSTSYGLAFRVGAPFEAGDFLIEPQFTSTWSFNNENRFTENGAGDLNLTYKNRSTTYVQTDLAMKFAYPIKTGDTSQFVPSLRVGWLGDWSDNLSNQTIGYQFTDDTVEIKSKNKDTNGLLLEAGLDYTIANINSSSYKVYVRGGIEAWGGDRGTDYRTSGGFEWQF